MTDNTEAYRTSQLVRWFEKMRILAWDRIAEALGKPSRITVFRKLAQLGARVSYSELPTWNYTLRPN
jgi:hypothetical protein